MPSLTYPHTNLLTPYHTLLHTHLLTYSRTPSHTPNNPLTIFTTPSHPHPLIHPHKLSPPLFHHHPPLQVCFVQKNTLRFIPASRTYHRYNTTAANNRNRTTVLPFTTTENRTWSLQVEFTLNSPLNAGDSITLYAPHYQYHNNIRDLPVVAGVSFAPSINTTLASLVPGYNNATNSSITPAVAYTGYTNVITRTITVITTYPLPNTTVRFTILNHPDLTVPTQKCNGNNCPIGVTISSLSCPLQGLTVHEQKTGLFIYAAIHVSVTNVIPTMFPTSQPSQQPSSQPSRVPTTLPSLAPTKPSSQPSSEPSRQPSNEPSGNLTTN